MAGEWIKMRKSLLGDPRVVRIMSALQADRFRTVGALFSAWCLIDEQTTDGILRGYTPAAFDEIVGVVGLANAMHSVGWLDIGEVDGVKFVAAPRFSEHNGATAKRRAQDAVRKMSAREADICPQVVRDVSARTEEEKTTGRGLEEEKNKNKKNTEEKSKSARDPAPEIADVKKYWTEQNLNGDPEAFFDHFEARGWISGRTKLKDWTKAANNWSRNQPEFERQSGNGQHKPKTFTQQRLENSVQAMQDFINET